MTTTTDVADYLGLDDGIPAGSVARVERLITKAEQLVAAELPGFTFTPATGATATVYGDADDYILLPSYPVSAVTACTIAGTTVPLDELDVDVLGRLRRLSSSYPEHLADHGGRLRWPDDGVAIVVTYDVAAASAVAPEVLAIVCELVAGRYDNPSQVTQESMGDRSRSYAAAAASGYGANLSPGQLRRLRNWRRTRVLASRVRQ